MSEWSVMVGKVIGRVGGRESRGRGGGGGIGGGGDLNMQTP